VSSSYRTDIDGLRSLAVIPVVLFHAGFSTFSGGYIGVDIFFVISGFLITTNIASELNSGSFSIAGFYDRRVRRILPALVSVVLFCIVVGYLLLTPSEYKNLGESITATMLFVSNVYFWRKTGYFEARSSDQPLLHTWSLSIEEQFYVGYPLLLTLLWRFARARTPLLMALFLLSLLGSILLVYYKPSAAFYLGPTRAWELLFGGLISQHGSRIKLSSPQASLLATIGLAFILFPIFLYTPSTPFPGLAAVPPVLGSGIIIWTGMHCSSPVNKLLSTGTLTSIGAASYSLYLWHWPLLLFARYVYGDSLPTHTAVTICLLSIAISFASLRFIERPFRFHPAERRRYFVGGAIMGTVTAGLCGLAINLNGGIPSRMDQVSIAYLDAERDKERVHTECMSLVDFIVPPSKACKLGADVEPTVLLWGDSHSMVTATAMEQAAIKNRSAFLFAADVDCPIGLGFGIDKKGPQFLSTPAYQYCRQYNADMLAFALASPNIRSVVFSSRWTNWRVGEPGAPSEEDFDIRLYTDAGTARSKIENREIFAAGFERLVKSLVDGGKQVWIVGPVPEPSVRIPKALYVQHLGFNNFDLDIPVARFLKKNEWVIHLFKTTAAKYPIKFLWPHQILCGPEKCPVYENDKPLYFDDNHLSIAGVLKTKPLYDEVFQNTSGNRVVVNPIGNSFDGFSGGLR
jgi:peptidoglycan/LPS O-acetylase OafA/YrhL